jgi:hypothetical protein
VLFVRHGSILTFRCWIGLQGLTNEDKRQYEAQAEKDKKRYAKALQVSNLLAAVLTPTVLCQPFYSCIALEWCFVVQRLMLCASGAGDLNSTLLS